MSASPELALVKSHLSFGTLRHPSYSTLPNDAPSPFDFLPLEIIQVLLRLAVDPEDPHEDADYPSSLNDLRLVCHYWNNAVVADPRMWSLIDFRWGKSWFYNSLERSRGAGLTVLCNYRGEARAPFPVVEFLAGVSKNLFRCVDVHMVFEVPQYARPTAASVKAIGAALADLLSMPAPMLEILCVSVAGWYKQKKRAPFALFGGDAPNLRDLEFVDSLLPYRSLGMTSLETFAMEEGWAPSLTDLLNLAQKCPDLTNLCVTALDTNTDFSLDVTSSTIYLPNLESLEVRGLMQDGVGYLLGAIHAPNCTAIIFDLNMRGLSLDNILGRSLLKNIDAALRRADSVCITLCNGKFQLITIVDEHEEINISFHHITNQLVALRTMFMYRAPYPARKLELIIHGTTEGLLTILGAQFPSATQVDIDCQAPFEWEQTLASLFKQQGDDKQVWQQLEGLSFRGHKSLIRCDGVDFLRYLRSRGRREEEGMGGKRKIGSLTVIGLGVETHSETTDLAEIDFIKAADELSESAW